MDKKKSSGLVFGSYADSVPQGPQVQLHRSVKQKDIKYI